jgi:hypothetical protein
MGHIGKLTVRAGSSYLLALRIGRSPARASTVAVASPVGQGYYPTISFAVQPMLAIDPYLIPRNLAVANNPKQPAANNPEQHAAKNPEQHAAKNPEQHAANMYYYKGPVTVNYITNIYPPGTIQAPRIAADENTALQHSLEEYRNS